VVVVDALDECDNDDDIKLIIYLFSQAHGLSSIHLRDFITSRPELPIRLGFRDISGRYRDVALHQLPEPVIEHDISAYLGHELAKIRDSYNSQAFDDHQLPADWPGQDIIRTLVQMAVPLFIFAATVCRFIADEAWLDPEGQLALVLDYQGGTSKLDKLGSTYLPVLEQLVVGKTGPARSRVLNEFREVVGPIVLLAEPLSASSLSHLVGISITSITRTLYRLHAVLDVPSRADSPIRPFHLSFHDFLTDPMRETDEFWIDETKMHRDTAMSCIHRLGSHLKKDICNLKQPGKARVEIDMNDIDTHLPAHIQYACRYWVFHLEQSKERIRDEDQVYEFLKCHFLHWLEALSLMGKAAESIVMVNILQTLVEVGTVQSSSVARLTSLQVENDKLSTFLYDANRFVLNGITSIDTAPLQVYCSAIIFAPESSVIRSMSKIPQWIAAKPDMEYDWNPCRQTLEGQLHVNFVAFSPDGKTLASASGDNTVKFWDMATGQCCQTLEAHKKWAYSVAFSPDGRSLVSGGGYSTVKLWDTATGQCCQTLEGHKELIKSVDFSCDGKSLASGSGDGTVKLWDALTGQCFRTFKGHTSWVYSVAFSPDGKTLASASGDHTVKLWDMATGQCCQTLDAHEMCVTFSPDGRTLASALSDGKLKLWDMATGQCCQTFEGHKAAALSVAFSPDSRILASGSASCDGIKLWDVVTGQCCQTLKGHQDWTNSVIFSYDGKYLASGSRDDTIKLWDTTAKQCYQIIEGHKDKVSSISFSYDGKTLTSTSYDSTVKLWDAVTGQCYQTLKGNKDWINSAVFSPDGTSLASASTDRTVKLWDAATGQCYKTLKSHKDWVSFIAFSYDGKSLASASHDGTVKLWDVVTGQCCQTLKCHKQFINSVAFSHDGKTIASASHDGTVKLWDVVTGQCCQTLDGHKDWVESVAFAPDGRTLVSGSWDETVKLWDLTTGQRLQTLAVGRTLYKLSFDSTDSSLHTDVGIFSLSSILPTRTSTTISTSQQPSTPQQPNMGYGISSDRAWITWNSDKQLWLPPEYRPLKSAVAGSTVALGCSSGRILIFRFSGEPSFRHEMLLCWYPALMLRVRMALETFPERH